MEKMENKPRERKSLLRIMIVALTIALVIVPWLIYNLYKIQVRDAKTLQNKAIAQQTRDIGLRRSDRPPLPRSAVPACLS